MSSYENKLHQLKDGEAMGSPLGPTLANFFQGTVDTKLLTQNLDFSPKTFFEITKQRFCQIRKTKVVL